MKELPLVNFQAKKSSGKTTLILAYINFGYKEVKQPIKIIPKFVMDNWHTVDSMFEGKIPFQDYDPDPQAKSKTVPCIVSTKISLPSAFWDNKKKEAFDSYEWV